MRIARCFPDLNSEVFMDIYTGYHTKSIPNIYLWATSAGESPAPHQAGSSLSRHDDVRHPRREIRRRPYVPRICNHSNNQ
jgi:hypothetical protein